MNSEQFKKLLDEIDGNSLQTLKEKNPKYAKKGDCLYNFKVGAELMNCTTAQACWNYMSKHLAELWGKIETNDFSNREDFLEKCQDTINYIRFLWCIGNEEVTECDVVSNEWEYEFLHNTQESAEWFINRMNDVKLRRGAISKAEVCKHYGMPFEQADYHVGWRSTDGWITTTGTMDENTRYVKIPRPVNI